MVINRKLSMCIAFTSIYCKSLREVVRASPWQPLRRSDRWARSAAAPRRCATKRRGAEWGSFGAFSDPAFPWVATGAQILENVHKCTMYHIPKTPYHMPYHIPCSIYHILWCGMVCGSGSGTGRTDGWTDGRTDGRTDGLPAL